MYVYFTAAGNECNAGLVRTYLTSPYVFPSLGKQQQNCLLIIMNYEIGFFNLTIKHHEIIDSKVSH